MLDGSLRWRYVPAERWRGRAAAVALLTFDVDAEGPLLAAGEQFAAHLSTMSHQAYGPRVGLPRILSFLARVDKPATFFFPGLIIERWPRSVELVLEAGHEIALHGYTHRPPATLDSATQIEELERGIRALERVGVKPTGYRAPMWSTSRPTMAALADYGIRYDSSMMDDDRPYLLDTPGGRIAELPVHWLLDDWEQYVYVPDPDFGHTINAPRAVADLWIAELDAMRETGSLCVLTCHPFASGRPSRIRAIEQFVAFAEQCGDVTFARADVIAAALLATDPADMLDERPA